MAIAFTSCLKNDVLYDYSDVAPVIINPKSNFPARELLAVPVADSLYGVKTLNLIVKYSFKTAPTKDVKVTLIKDDALVAAYNAKFLTTYKVIPSNCWENRNLEVTISAGKLQAVLPITLVPGNMNPADKYIMAFTISSAEGVTVASNFKSMVFTLKTK